MSVYVSKDRTEKTTQGAPAFDPSTQIDEGDIAAYQERSEFKADEASSAKLETKPAAPKNALWDDDCPDGLCLAPPKDVEQEAVDLLNDEIIEKRSRFLGTIRKLKAKGVKMKAEDGVIFFGDEDTQLTDKKIKPIESIVSSANIFIADGSKYDTLLGLLSPDLFIENAAMGFLDTDKALIDEDAETSFPAVTMHIEDLGDRTMVTLWNWFESTPFFQETYPNKPNPSLPHARIAKEIKDHISKFDFEGAIDAIDALSKDDITRLRMTDLYRLERPKGMSFNKMEAAKESLKSLSGYWAIGIEATPFHADADRHVTAGISNGLSLNVDADVIDELDDKALFVDGFLYGISMELRFSGREPWRSEKYRKEGERLKKKGFGCKGGCRSLGNFIIDKYGNRIYLEVKTDKYGTDLSKIYILPPIVFAKEGEDYDKVHVLGVDLTEAGFGDHPALLARKALPPATVPSEDKPYYLYSTLPITAIGDADAAYDRVAGLAADAESLFGFEPGEQIKNIVFTPSKYENAYVSMTNHDTLFILEEMLPEINKGNRDFVVFHEMCHGLDMLYDFSSHPAFSDIFDTLDYRGGDYFFDMINEKDFLMVDNGGHANDSSMEFFASIMNSLRAENWEGTVLDMDYRVRGIYYHSLLGLKEALADKYPPIVQSPVYKSIEEKIAFMELANLDHEGNIAAYEPLEELALPHPAEYLKKISPQTVLATTENYEREVLRADGKVVVVPFINRSDINYIVSLSRHLEGEAKVVAVEGRVDFEILKEILEDNDSFAERTLFTPYIVENGKLIYESKNNIREDMNNALIDILVFVAKR